MTVGSDRGWWVVEEMVSRVNLREEVVHSEPGEECVAVWGVGAVRQGGWSWSELTRRQSSPASKEQASKTEPKDANQEGRRDCGERL